MTSTTFALASRASSTAIDPTPPIGPVTARRLPARAPSGKQSLVCRYAGKPTAAKASDLSLVAEERRPRRRPRHIPRIRHLAPLALRPSLASSSSPIALMDLPYAKCDLDHLPTTSSQAHKETAECGGWPSYRLEF